MEQQFKFKWSVNKTFQKAINLSICIFLTLVFAFMIYFLMNGFLPSFHRENSLLLTVVLTVIFFMFALFINHIYQKNMDQMFEEAEIRIQESVNRRKKLEEDLLKSRTGFVSIGELNKKDETST